MRKAFKIIGAIIIFIVLLLLWFDQSRSFYCVDGNKYITVWKRSKGICYIIPDKYYGIFSPSNGYIKSTIDNAMTIYWTKSLPNTLIIKCGNDYTISNSSSKNKITIIDYNSDSTKYHAIIYKSSLIQFGAVKENVDFIDLGILEGYAKDKYGKNL
jgi:hypothetical protein